MKTMDMIKQGPRLLRVNLRLFDQPNPNTNVSTDGGLTDGLKTYYSEYLIDLAEPLLVHDQFGQKHPIPQDSGKTIEFRKYDPFPKALTPLQEGVTPDGRKMSLSTLEGTIQQYGDYVTLSDIVSLVMIDKQLVQATKALASQAGRTLDTITREVLSGGTNVQYADGQVLTREDLVGGAATGNMYLTVNAIKLAVRYLKTQNAPTINGDYVGIIHPDCTYDLMSDPQWLSPKEYVDTDDIYNGEIGKLYGVRFVETTEAKKFVASPLTEGATTLTVRVAVTASTTRLEVTEAITAADAVNLVGRDVLIDGVQHQIGAGIPGAAGSAAVTLTAPVDTVAAGASIEPTGAGAGGRDVYATLILGDDAYGVTELSGGGLQHIVKGLGSAGSADPLNQRQTAGWKATKVAIRLVEPYMVRIETTSTFSDGMAN